MLLLYFPASLPLSVSLRLLYCLAAAFGKTEAITSHQGRLRRPLHRHSLGRERASEADPLSHRRTPFIIQPPLSLVAIELQSSAASAVISDVLDALKGKIAICLKSSPSSTTVPPRSRPPSLPRPLSRPMAYPNMTSRVGRPRPSSSTPGGGCYVVPWRVDSRWGSLAPPLDTRI